MIGLLSMGLHGRRAGQGRADVSTLSIDPEAGRGPAAERARSRRRVAERGMGSGGDQLATKKNVGGEAEGLFHRVPGRRITGRRHNIRSRTATASAGDARLLLRHSG
jgi:hypothetical protein